MGQIDESDLPREQFQLHATTIDDNGRHTHIERINRIFPLMS